MLKTLTAMALRNPLAVIGAAVAIVVVSLANLDRVPVDIFPTLNAPTVVIISETGGLAADEVEQFVTFPIESAVNGLPGVRRVRSGSSMSLSIVWVEFDWGFDIYRARQLVSERLALARESLPDNVHAQIAPISSPQGEIMLLTLKSPDGSISPLDLRAYAEFDLRSRLLSIPGISQVVAIGGELPEYQINLRQDRLALYGLSSAEVVEAAREAHSIASAGYLQHVGGRELPIRQTGRVRSVADIRDTVIRYDQGRAVTLGDVAEVTLAGAPKRGTGSDNARPAVILSVQKVPEANTLELTQAIDKVLERIQPGLPKGMELNARVFRQSDFIHRGIDNVLSTLRDAAIIVTVVLVIFLMNLRVTMITLITLPLSLGLGILGLWGLGYSINVMTLGGLAVAVGELVDDAIIYVENSYRRLRLNAMLPKEERRSVLSVILGACEEIRSSVVFATLIVILVFLPLLFLDGLEGRFFRPLGVAYICGLVASFFVAITVTPVLSRLLLSHIGEEEKEEATHDSRAVRVLKQHYAPWLERTLRHPYRTMGGSAILIALALLLASTFGTSFLPKFSEGTFTVFLMAPPGTSLAASDRLAQGVEAQLTKIEGVRSVVRRTGRAERDEHAEPVSNSEIEIAVKDGYVQDEVQRRIDKVLAHLPGITTTIGQPIEHRLSHILSGTPAAIAINVYGDDLATLRTIAKEVEQTLKTIPGARDVAGNRELQIRSLAVRFRPQDLRRWGLTPASAATQLQVAFGGETVTTVNQGVKRYEVVVRLHEDERREVKQLKEFILHTPGGSVRLKEVADVGHEMVSNLIGRTNLHRKATISCNVSEGHNLGHLITKVREKVDRIVSRYGYTVEYGGQFEAQQSASRSLLFTSSVILVIMLILLASVLKSIRAALLVMINLPLALIGGIVAVFLSESASPFGNILALIGLGGEYQAPILSVASLVGFITIFSLAVRNGILLVKHYEHLVIDEKLPFAQAVRRGSLERLVPILMTAFTSILGLVPIALAAGQPGSELVAPLAIVGLGGLLTSTLLNLFVVPAGFTWLFGGKHPLADDAAEDV